MPFCPNCREEFRPGIGHCPDCNVELVESLEEKSEEPEERVVFIATSTKDVAERVQRLCKRSGIPCMISTGDLGLYFPLEYAGRALGWISNELNDLVIEPPGEKGSPPLIRDMDPERDGIPVITKEDLEDRERLLDKLLEAAVKGDVRAHNSAVTALIKLGEDGIERIRVLIRELCLAKEEERLGWVFHACGEMDIPGIGETILPILENSDPDVIALALRAAWKFRAPEISRKACRLLLHDNEVVQEEADEYLIEITGKDIGFEPGMDYGERERAYRIRLEQVEMLE